MLVLSAPIWGFLGPIASPECRSPGTAQALRRGGLAGGAAGWRGPELRPGSGAVQQRALLPVPRLPRGALERGGGADPDASPRGSSVCRGVPSPIQPGYWVGFQNHRGAMMELGEGLCKLRKMDFDGGPFHEFEQEVSAALEFLYQTQKELAACAEDICLAMDGSERSYQLLGSFAAGQRLYSLDVDLDGIAYITFSLVQNYPLDKSLRVKVPTLHATEEHLKACEYKC